MKSKQIHCTMMSSIVIALIALFMGTPKLYSQTDDEIVIDTIDYGENLLDSNEVYKKKFDSLSNHGEWSKMKKSELLEDIGEETGEDFVSDFEDDGKYIYFWRPFSVDAGWNPYYNGRWMFTYYGWQWISYYDWGWAPYNYGRWYYSWRHGWIWLPGSVWAVNWVTWQYYNNFVMWYPQCPKFYWRNKYNRHCRNYRYAYKPSNWVVVEAGNMFKRIDGNTIVNISGNRDILKKAVKNAPRVYDEHGYPEVKYYGPDINVVSNEAGVKTVVNEPVFSTNSDRVGGNVEVKNTYGSKDVISEVREENSSEVKKQNKTVKPKEGSERKSNKGNERVSTEKKNPVNRQSVDQNSSKSSTRKQSGSNNTGKNKNGSQPGKNDKKRNNSDVKSSGNESGVKNDNGAPEKVNGAEAVIEKENKEVEVNDGAR